MEIICAVIGFVFLIMLGAVGVAVIISALVLGFRDILEIFR